MLFTAVAVGTAHTFAVGFFFFIEFGRLFRGLNRLLAVDVRSWLAWETRRDIDVLCMSKVLWIAVTALWSLWNRLQQL